MKTILITGGSRGIGKATALVLGKEGYRILVGYNKNKESAEKVAKEIGNDSKAIRIDVTKPEEIKKASEENIDILINNAGVLFSGKHTNLSDEDIIKQTNVNVNGVFLVTKAFLEQLEKKKGTIINISSVAPRYSSPRYIAYAATKAAVVNFTIGLSKEYPEIKSYSISPGLTATDMTANSGVPAEKVSKVVSNVLSGEIKMNSGEDIDVRNHY